MDRASLLNDAEESMRLILDGRQACLWTALPGIVDKVNLTAVTCDVRPAIKAPVTDEDGNVTLVELPLLLDVPIVFPQAGGFAITLPLAVGDEVLVVFASRAIDAWWQSGGVQSPVETRMHDLSDAFAIPGPMSQTKKISGISATKAQIRNNAGTTYVEIGADGKIGLVSASEIDLTAPLVKVTGALTVTGALLAASLATSGGGSATIGGSINVTGNITAAQVTAGGIGLSTHQHTGVTTGGGTSGGPV